MSPHRAAARSIEPTSTSRGDRGGVSPSRDAATPSARRISMRTRTDGVVDRVAALGTALEEHIRAIVRDELHSGPSEGADEWVDQDSSPLKRKKYLELVRKGELKGKKVGRQVLVRRSELDAYLEAHAPTQKIEAAAGPDDRSQIDEQLAKLGFVG